ncbi:S66 peptidase family protein [Bacillus sp. 1P06AnD]|uniref:S66 peptidase family protein n=1 Tax=Bacillus sp. 1P06AnD TaxID=3132208 RepID=UPI0039A395F9
MKGEIQMYKKPKKLAAGDTVGIIAPASPPDQMNLLSGIEYLKQLGLKVKLGKHVFEEKGYLAGNDRDRAEDVNAMFQDPEVQAIVSACGGYGTGRIASLLDYELIGENPKIFWGYSDLTFLHTSIRQKSGLITFHGPMVASDMGKDKWSEQSSAYFKQLFHSEAIVYDESISSIEAAYPGYAKGELVGGNLCLLVSTLGTDYEIDTKGKLLFFEDINEEPRNIDRMLNQLWMAGKLEDVQGIVLGDFQNCEPGDRAKTRSLDEVLDEYIQRIGKPALKGLKMGHCSPHIGMPLGTIAEMDTSERKLVIESGISD